MTALATYNNTWTLEEMADQFGPLELHKPLSKEDFMQLSDVHPTLRIERETLQSSQWNRTLSKERRTNHRQQQPLPLCSFA
jgi:hypothetical protein